MPIEEKQEVQNLRCRIVKVLYHKEEFSICLCYTKNEIPDNANQNNRSKVKSDTNKRFTVLGHGLPKEGAEILVSGNWEWSSKYNNLQFRVVFWSDYVEKNKEAIVAYLSSGIIKGIGAKMAETIYDEFGNESVNIVQNNPEKLLEISGIKQKKLQKIIESYERNNVLSSLVALLAPYNVSFKTITRVYKTMGEQAAHIVRSNPYSLCTIRGFGFKTVDKLAQNMGIESHSPYRLRGAIQYVLEKAQSDEGHVFLFCKQLMEKCCSPEILNYNNAENPVTEEEVKQKIKEMLHDKTLQTIDDKCDAEEQRIYNAASYADETVAAQNIARFIERVEIHKRSERKNVIQEVQKRLGVKLDTLQEDAVLNCLSNRLSIITGGPGTGKTTTLNVLVRAKMELGCAEEDILLAAPTGRAARRMSEQTGLDALTLHSMLGLKPGTHTDFSSESPEWGYTDAQLLIVDEFSMVDAHLFAELMFRVPSKLQIVFVGDADQLPSVGPGNVFQQLLSMKEIPCVRLEKVFRQDAGSIIPVNSQHIRRGDANLSFNKYFKFVRCENEEEGAKWIVSKFSTEQIQRSLDSIQILAPMRKRGATSINNLNEKLHDIVNPRSSEKMEETIGGTLFRVGDKVMQTKNTGPVSNGDIGYITSITPMLNGDKDSFAMTVSFQSYDTPIEYDYMDALELEPATAITIHKSQGSEFPVVVIPIFSSMTFFLQRNLLYTAVTRAKQQVVLIGNEEAIRNAIWRVSNTKRNTALAQLIKSEMSAM